MNLTEKQVEMVPILIGEIKYLLAHHQLDRDLFFQGCRNPVTNEVDDAGDAGTLDEMDLQIRGTKRLLAAFKKAGKQ